MRQSVGIVDAADQFRGPSGRSQMQNRTDFDGPFPWGPVHISSGPSRKDSRRVLIEKDPQRLETAGFISSGRKGHKDSARSPEGSLPGSPGVVKPGEKKRGREHFVL